MIFNFTNLSFIQKGEIKCPESRKKLTTQYKLLQSEQWTPVDNQGREGQNFQNLAGVFYG